MKLTKKLHSPGLCEIHDEDHNIVACCNPIENGCEEDISVEEAEIISDEITKRWNCHEELVECLRELVDEYIEYNCKSYNYELVDECCSILDKIKGD